VHTNVHALFHWLKHNSTFKHENGQILKLKTSSDVIIRRSLLNLPIMFDPLQVIVERRVMNIKRCSKLKQVECLFTCSAMQ
jgi:hypothetical protein